MAAAPANIGLRLLLLLSIRVFKAQIPSITYSLLDSQVLKLDHAVVLKHSSESNYQMYYYKPTISFAAVFTFLKLLQPFEFS
jgi:hypothetical protein